MCCMCTWRMHMNNDLCALMWKSEEVEPLPLLLSTSYSGGMVHHWTSIPLSSWAVWSESSWESTCFCLQMLGLHSYICLLSCFLFSCACVLCTSVCMCGDMCMHEHTCVWYTCSWKTKVNVESSSINHSSTLLKGEEYLNQTPTWLVSITCKLCGWPVSVLHGWTQVDCYGYPECMWVLGIWNHILSVAQRTIFSAPYVTCYIFSGPHDYPESIITQWVISLSP